MIRVVAVAAAATVVVVVAACAPARQAWEDTFSGSTEDAFLLDDDFTCIGDDSYAPVDGAQNETVRVKNVLDHQDEAVRVATEKTAGDRYPVGTILQLFPSEASVKRGVGFSAATNDWEFVQLDVGSGRTVITARGTTQMANPGGTCMSCHGPSQDDFDLACFSNTQCVPFPFFLSNQVNPDNDDARCR